MISFSSVSSSRLIPNPVDSRILEPTGKILKLNPFVTLDDEEDGEESISIGGAHPRTNDIRVDGVSFNDDFGLNDNGYPSQRSPINFGSIKFIKNNNGGNNNV